MPLKIDISINDANYLTKCNGKLCYICGTVVSSYKKLWCGCGDQNCEVCKLEVPINVPICNKLACIDKQADNPPPPVKPEDS